MSGLKTLAQSIQSMTEALEKIKADDLTLEQMMEQFSIAANSYQEFESNMSKESLDVKEVKIDETGATKETDFEWRSM